MDTKRQPRLGGLGALAGGLACAGGVLAGEAVAALIPGVTGPVLAVGNRAVDWAPRTAKEVAIETFGTADKAVLIGSIVVVVAVLALILGWIGARRPRVAVGGFTTLVLLAAVTIGTDRAASAALGLRLIPMLAIAVVGIGGLVLLLRPLTRGGRHSADFPQAHHGPTDSASPTMIGPSVDRRAFVVAASTLAGTGVAAIGVTQATGGALAATSRSGLRLPPPAEPSAPIPAGATFPDIGGLTPYMTKNADFYRIDTALAVPDVPLSTYRLRIHGMVDNPLELGFQDLLDRELIEKRITMTCVSNPVGGDYTGNALWLGVPMKALLKEAGVQAGADAVKSTSADDFTAGTPLHALTDDRGALVAVGMNGDPLPLEHGFPVRMVTPGLYGYVSATKWLIDLEVTRFATFSAYWTDRGYAAQAPIKVSARIDTPASFAQLPRGEVTVAGVAWAQGVGVERVEVRVSGDTWHDAELAEVDSNATWRPWRWTWPAKEGAYRLEVRATDADGTTQTSQREPIAPDGSTGWHSVAVTVT